MPHTVEYHQSSLSLFFRCPKSFELSMAHEAILASTTLEAMREGQLFEYFALGENERFDYDKARGKWQDKRVNRIKEHASKVAQSLGEGEPYRPILLTGDHYHLGGEMDFLGQIDHVDVLGVRTKYDKAIVDLKYTGNVTRLWDGKVTKADYLQAIMYCYIHWMNEGELLPFVFLVADAREDDCLVRCIEIEVEESDFHYWLIPFIEKIHYTPFMPAYPGGACVGRRGKSEGQCWFLKYCKEGQAHIGGTRKFTFKDLEEVL